jgi:hypothetical protein
MVHTSRIGRSFHRLALFLAAIPLLVGNPVLPPWQPGFSRMVRDAVHDLAIFVMRSN